MTKRSDNSRKKAAVQASRKDDCKVTPEAEARDAGTGSAHPEPPEKNLEWLKRCGARLHEEPLEKRRVGRGEDARDAMTRCELLMYELLKVRGKNGRLRHLLLNRAQQNLERRSTNRNIVLKARQLGVATYVAARFFISTISREGTLSVQVAHDQRSAEEIFRIVHRFLENLPEWLRKGALVTSRANVRQIVFPMLDSEYRVETAADDCVQTAWEGEYKVVSDFLPAGDVTPGDAVQVSARARGAEFGAIVRAVEVQVISLRDDRSHYDIKFTNEADQPLALQLESITLPGPLNTVYTTGTPSSSLYLDSLTAAQVTNVIASEITVDAGIAPPAGGGIEVRRSDGGWGTGDSGNLAGRFTTQTFTLPRLSRVQGYYLRQYDGSAPAKYSRYSALLHVNYPL